LDIPVWRAVARDENRSAFHRGGQLPLEAWGQLVEILRDGRRDRLRVLPLPMEVRQRDRCVAGVSRFLQESVHVGGEMLRIQLCEQCVVDVEGCGFQ
jgi:hypothetical protein